MSYTRRIVCLANSKKPNGRCVAGIEVTGAGYSNWIRPVSARASEELNPVERRCVDGQEVALLDIVDIEFLQHRPHACQKENHVTNAQRLWIRSGRAAPRDLLPAALDTSSLWIDGYHSYSGMNDRIPEATADLLPSSLRLVTCPDVTIMVSQGYNRREVRVNFSLGQSSYKLKITDPVVEAKYLAETDGEFRTGRPVLMCISLGEPFDGYRYKLAASLIPIP